MPLVHHELCFGCGRTNLFGLLLEVEPMGPGAVAGRCFIKQDHQGPNRGNAHDGIIATALVEAMLLACGPEAALERLEVSFEGQAPVGSFVEIEARAETSMSVAAHASVDGVQVARATGSFGPDGTPARERSGCRRT
jgi:acyl-coenzyme A thioesterase PaaI-like protein